MSRVVYTQTATTPEQQALRETHSLRVVTGEEEGTGVDGLPDGVYGFTYSPGVPNAPLFAVPRFRNYETQKRFDGETYLLGFVPADVAAQVAAGGGDVRVELYPQPQEGAATLVELPYARIRRNQQHAAPNQETFSAVVAPA